MALGLSGALCLKALGFVSLSLVDRDVQYQFLVYLLPALSICASLLLIRSNVKVGELAIFLTVGESLRGAARFFARLPQRPALAEGRPGPR